MSMASTLSFRGLLGRQPVLARLAPLSSRFFSTAATLLANNKPGPKGAAAKFAPSSGAAKRRKGHAARSEHHARIRVLKRNMFSPAPPPLRMARLRHLRHWTIHRAWQLFRRQQHEMIDKERHRMHAGMFNACEELRKTVGPGGRGEGYLYRVAMEKKGVYGLKGVPIEYARLQTDSPARQAWNHDWKR